MDYKFKKCLTTLCISVTIVDDNIVEGEGNFSVSLLRPAGLNSRLTLDPAEAEVTITDNDGMFH